MLHVYLAIAYLLENCLPDSLSLLLAFHFFWIVENANCSVLRFSVDNSSGEVTTASSGPSYDRETTPEYFLTIMATDGGGATTTTRVHVTLDDINDQHPVFLRPEYRAFLKENSNHFDVGVTAQVGAFLFLHVFLHFKQTLSTHQPTREESVFSMQMRSCAIDFWSKAHHANLFSFSTFQLLFLFVFMEMFFLFLWNLPFYMVAYKSMKHSLRYFDHS